MTTVTGQLQFGIELPTALYRLFAEHDRLLYIGITDDLKARMAAHAAQKTWWGDVVRTTVDWLPTRQEALLAEAAAIRAERPVHNVQHSVTQRRPVTTEHVRAVNEMVADGYRMAAEILLLESKHLAESITDRGLKQSGTLTKIAAELDALAKTGTDGLPYLKQLLDPERAA